jgi:hypothetical protein
MGTYFIGNTRSTCNFRSTYNNLIVMNKGPKLFTTMVKSQTSLGNFSSLNIVIHTIEFFHTMIS